MDTRNLQNLFWKIRSNRFFEAAVISIIVVSALLVGAKTYDLPPEIYQVFSRLDLVITLFFLLEISIRFLGEEKKHRFFFNGWNLFDTLIVVVSLVPIEHSETAVIGRLVRVFRVLRMVSMIPELRLLLNSLLKALPQLGFVILLMFIIFYIYAAFGAIFFAGINPDLWGDIGISMLTLFRVMTFEDWTDVMYETMSVYKFSWVYYLTFLFLTAFAFLNMVIGVVVNVLEEERAAQQQKDNPQPSLSEIQQQMNRLEMQLGQLLERR